MHHPNSFRIVGLVVLLLVSPFFITSVKTKESQRSRDDNAATKWEYLVVSNASRTNFQPTGNSRMRKEEMGGFGIESFVLEQHLDNVGANGWELVAVGGSPSDPIYYFKRPRQRRD
jgi:hypothetical protein